MKQKRESQIMMIWKMRLLIVLFIFYNRQNRNVSSFHLQSSRSITIINSSFPSSSSLKMYSFARIFDFVSNVNDNTSSTISTTSSTTSGTTTAAVAVSTPTMSIMEQRLVENSNLSLFYNFFRQRKYVDSSSSSSSSSRKMYWPIPSRQKQISVMERIGKAVYEESLPWIVTLVIASSHALILQSTLPLTLSIVSEVLFLTYCTMKLVLKFNIPSIPEPLLRNEDWEQFAELVWSSQRNISENRKYVMGWFYDKPFDSLREEDAIAYLVWMKHGVPYEDGEGYNFVSDVDVDKIKRFDLPLLVERVNNGFPLPKRRRGEEALPLIQFNFEPLRFRHKPLIFYGVTHGIHLILHKILEKNDFNYVPANDPKKDIGYWYRLPSTTTDDSSDNKSQSNNYLQHSPLVFCHGVGGLGFCYKMIDDLLDNDTFRANTPVILLDLPHVSLRMYDHIPEVTHQVEAMTKIIDDVTSQYCKQDDKGNEYRQPKATFVGHSYGTFLLSWMVQAQPEMVGACVFLDPVCFNLHLKDILFNFHMQRVDKISQDGKKWSNPFDIGALMNMAGSEMHTNNAMLRQFSWSVNALWPEDLKKNNIPTQIILTEKDEIVPIKSVQDLFSSYNGKLNKLEQCAKVTLFENACHGQMFFEESLRKETVGMILGIMDKSRKVSTLSDTINRIKKEYHDLNESVGEFWDQIAYILPKRANAQPPLQNMNNHIDDKKTLQP